MDVSLSRPEPHAEIGSFDESIFPPDVIKVDGASIFKNNGGKYGRSRRMCRPVELDRIASWNIEGMAGDSKVKFAELRVFMKQEGIIILCIQETHVVHIDCYIEDGFTIFLSGAGEDVSKSYAGVGFIVAPWAIKAVVQFSVISDRLANLRVKVTGGVLNLLTMYAPHDGYTFDIRHSFFSTLCQHTRSKHLHETTTMVL